MLSPVIALRPATWSVSAGPFPCVMLLQVIMKFWLSFLNATATSNTASKATASHTSAS